MSYRECTCTARRYPITIFILWQVAYTDCYTRTLRESMLLYGLTMPTSFYRIPNQRRQLHRDRNSYLQIPTSEETRTRQRPRPLASLRLPSAPPKPIRAESKVKHKPIADNTQHLCGQAPNRIQTGPRRTLPTANQFHQRCAISPVVASEVSHRRIKGGAGRQHRQPISAKCYKWAWATYSTLRV